MPRRANDYIPRKDSDFSTWASHYYDAVNTWWTAHSLDKNELDALKNALDKWGARYANHVAAQAAAQGASQAKDDARAELERQIRPVANFVQTYSKTTDADRAEIGITVRDTSRTPSPTPTTRPLVTVNPGQRLTHTLRLVDSGEHTGAPTGRARGGKPEGAIGAEVWVKLIDAGQPTPTDPSALSFLALTTRPTLRTTFRTADGGKTAVYMLRWVNTRGEKGPWSEVTTATVAA